MSLEAKSVMDPCAPIRCEGDIENLYVIQLANIYVPVIRLKCVSIGTYRIRVVVGPVAKKW